MMSPQVSTSCQQAATPSFRWTSPHSSDAIITDEAIIIERRLAARLQGAGPTAMVTTGGNVDSGGDGKRQRSLLPKLLVVFSMLTNLALFVVVLVLSHCHSNWADAQSVPKPARLQNPFDQISGVSLEDTDAVDFGSLSGANSNNKALTRPNRAKPAEHKLLRYLLDNYDRRVRPVKSVTQVLNVTFGLALSQIIDVDEKNQVVTTNCWLNQHWLDFQLQWDPDKFDGIKIIRLPYNTIWLPDILLYNNADVMTYVSAVSTNVIAQYDGNVTWLSMMIFKSTCAIDVKYFPFDEQNCSLFFASWTYDGFQMNIEANGVEGDLSNYIENTEWHLVKLIQHREVKFFSCCPNEPYPFITYFVVVRRRPLFYVYNMMLPCILITLVALLGFYVPSDSGEKVTMGITTLLSMTVFLMVVAENMPPTKNQLPLLGLFYGFTIVVVSCATAMTVLTLNIHHKGKRGIRLPKFLRFICFQILARFVLFRVHLPNSHILEEAKARKAKMKFDEENMTDQQRRMLSNGTVCSGIQLPSTLVGGLQWPSTPPTPRSGQARFVRDLVQQQQQGGPGGSLERNPGGFDSLGRVSQLPVDGSSLERRGQYGGNQSERLWNLRMRSRAGAHPNSSQTELLDMSDDGTTRPRRSVAFSDQVRPSGDYEDETEFLLGNENSARPGPSRHLAQRPVSEPTTPTLHQNNNNSGLSPRITLMSAQIEAKLDMIINRANSMADISEGRLRERELKDAISLEWQQAAAIVDRLLLMLFLSVTMLVTLAILFRAPNQFLLWDDI